MPVETIASEAVSVAKTATKITESLAKKAWSIMDAASEKAQPSEYLSTHAIQSIQGKGLG
jgi:hypothetical protein